MKKHKETSKKELTEALRDMVNIATHPKATKAEIKRIAEGHRRLLAPILPPYLR